MKISMELSEKSVADAIKQVKEYQKSVDRKMRILTEKRPDRR